MQEDTIGGVGEAVIGTFGIFVIPASIPIIIGMLIAFLILFLLRFIESKKHTSGTSVTITQKLGWRLKLLLNASAIAVVAYFVKNELYKEEIIGFVIAFGPSVVFWLSLVLVFLSLVFVVSKFIADGLSRKT